MVEVFVAGISLDKNDENPQVLLQNEDGTLALSFGTGAFEAGAIIVEMEKVRTPAPFTHDSFAGFLTRHGFKLDHLFLHSFVLDTCSAEMVYRKGLRRFTSGIKPGDGIALALRLGAPLYVPASERALGIAPWAGLAAPEERSVLLVGQARLHSHFLH